MIHDLQSRGRHCLLMRVPALMTSLDTMLRLAGRKEDKAAGEPCKGEAQQGRDGRGARTDANGRSRCGAGRARSCTDSIGAAASRRDASGSCRPWSGRACGARGGACGAGQGGPARASPPVGESTWRREAAEEARGASAPLISSNFRHRMSAASQHPSSECKHVHDRS